MSSPFMPTWTWELLDSAGHPLLALTQATARSVSWPLNAPCTAQFTMPARSAPGEPHQTGLIKEMATDVLVSRAGHALYRGRIVSSTEQHSAQGDTVTFTATDYRGLLDHRIIWPASMNLDYPDPPGWAPAEIAWAIIAEMQGVDAQYNLGIHLGPGGVPSGGAATYTLTGGGSVGQAINDLGNGAGGFDWEIDRNLDFNAWSPTRGADHGVDLVYGAAPDPADPALMPVVSVSTTVTPDGYANALWMTGAAGTIPETMPFDWPVPALSPAGYGAWDKQMSDPTQTVQTALADFAGGWYQTLSNAGTGVPVPAFALVLVAGVWDPSTLGVGDTAHVTVAVGRLSITAQPERVGQLDVALDDDGVETVTVTLAPAADPSTHMAPVRTTLASRFKTIDGRITKLELAPAQAAVIIEAEAGPVSVGAINTWTTVVAYTPTTTGNYEVAAYIKASAGNASARVTYNDGAGPATMTLWPLQAATAGDWSPPKALIYAYSGTAITVQVYVGALPATASAVILQT